MLRLRQIMKMIVIVMIICLHAALLSGQSMKEINIPKSISPLNSAIEPRPLEIGEYVPDLELAMVNYFQPKIRLSDFQGKLIIIDFWATWCTSCFYKFPKIDSLQKYFGDKIKILLVNGVNTGDSKIKVIDFIAKWNKKYDDIQLSSALGDSLTNTLFKHDRVPHYVWINYDLKLVGITGSEEITIENIQKILNNEYICMPLKNDMEQK